MRIAPVAKVVPTSDTIQQKLSGPVDVRATGPLVNCLTLSGLEQLSSPKPSCYAGASTSTTSAATLTNSAHDLCTVSSTGFNAISGRLLLSATYGTNCYDWSCTLDPRYCNQ